MSNFKNNTKLLTYVKSKYNHSLLKKVAISSVAFTTLMIGTAGAERQITTVYHVYIDGERIGTVDNKNVIDKIIDTKIDSLKKNYQDLSFVADNLVFVPEQVFRANASNEATAKKVAADVNIVAEAYVLTVEDKEVAYLKTKEEADDAIKQLMLQYVTEEQLTELETRKKSNATLQPLGVGQSRLLDVTVNEKVSIAKEEISPEKLLSVADTVTLLKQGTLEKQTYVAKEGDVLGTIANNHGLPLAEFLALNPGVTEDTVVDIGQEFNVTAYKPYITIVVKMEETVSQAIAHSTEVVEDSSMYKGSKKTKQEGQDGEKVVNSTVELQNGVAVKRDVISETVTRDPVTEIVLKGTKVVPSRGTGQLAWPTVGGYVSSHLGYRWGQMHKGIDIARPSNRTIKAADNGTVVSAGWDGGYGNKIVINHNNGIRTVYAHLASITVSVGQTVVQGQQIGVMGATGNSTGVHLHFEVYENGALKNPLLYLR